jgi:hypothetical protein
MAHMDVVDSLVDVERLRNNRGGGIWGFYHEIGHNHQSSDWTFEGTGEVTVNLFTLYVMEKVCGIPSKQTRRVLGPGREAKLRAYFADGAPFSGWKRDPFLALIMYVQLVEEFGWDAYRHVFRQYRALPDRDRPRSDQAKRDRWMVLFSEEVDRDLGPFFERWGVPTSSAARQRIADLPPWMPDELTELP